MLTAGALIAGKYRVIKKLGEGAMGSVWLAKNEVTDREFAIKLLLPEAAGAPSALARFLREARVCGALRHPSILEIYDAGAAPEIGGAPYLVMERLDGAPLDTVLRLRGALAPRLALDIVAQISRGLELAHAKGIVHRDLKPANVFLHRPGSGAIEPKVLDFGISKVVSPKSPEIALTNTSAILGSPIYMSPEQMSFEGGLDARSDVHALGVLLWELLTGNAPFVSTSYNLLVVEIMRGPRPKLRDAMPAASRSRSRRIVERVRDRSRERPIRVRGGARRRARRQSSRASVGASSVDGPRSLPRRAGPQLERTAPDAQHDDGATLGRSGGSFEFPPFRAVGAKRGEIVRDLVRRYAGRGGFGSEHPPRLRQPRFPPSAKGTSAKEELDRR